MAAKSRRVVRLSDLAPGQEADVFLLLTAKEELRTRDGKPYYRVAWRDPSRELSFPVWSDGEWAEACRDAWTPGTFYKVRGVYRETSYGPQLEIHKIRPASESDAADGFDPREFRPASRHDPAVLFGRLRTLCSARIADEPLRTLVLGLLDAHRPALESLPAARGTHHAYVGGLIEHVLSVTELCVEWAERFAAAYPELKPPLSMDLVVAGAALHDLGKVQELQWQPEGPGYTPAGQLLGHVVQGRDLVRAAAAELPLSQETLLRLEHLLVAHHGTPELGSPKPPQTPEALLVRHADDLDARFQMLAAALADDASPGPFTSRKNALGYPVYRGPLP